MRTALALGAVVCLAACAKSGPAKTPTADSTAAPTVATPVTDSTKAGAPAAPKPAADSAKPAVPAAPAAPAAVKKATDAAKVETGGYDKAMKPRFKIDEKTGKIDTIRKP